MGHNPACMCCGRSDDEVLETIADHVEREGSTFVFVIGPSGRPGEPGARPPFAYTIGMWRNFGAPELVTYAMRPDVLNETRERIREGLVIHPHKKIPGILRSNAGEFYVVFAEITGDDDVFNWARKYYEVRGQPDDLKFPRMQLIWPDEAGIFPWEDGWDTRFVGFQPKTGAWPEKGAKI